MKEQEVLDKNYSPKNYITERLECKSHDSRLIPLTITRHKDTKIDGTANVLLYGYGSYGNSLVLAFQILDLVYLIEILFGLTHLLEVGESVEKSGMKKEKC